MTLAPAAVLAALLALGASAQDAPAPAAPAAAPSRSPLKDLDAALKEQRATLRAAEKDAVQAVSADTSLPEAEKKARVKAVHQDYRARRKALNAEFEKRREAARAARRAQAP